MLTTSVSVSSNADVLYFGSIASFVAGLLLLMSFASPYWLQSWESTFSPFKKMGLWEFCFFKFRHPDYQFDKLFHGCHALYGDDYRLIREKLLPGWLMVVQFFITVALILSYIGQVVVVALLLRWPLEVILRFEWQFCGLALVCNACTGESYCFPGTAPEMSGAPDLDPRVVLYRLQPSWFFSASASSGPSAGTGTGSCTPTTTTCPGATPSPSSPAWATSSRRPSSSW